MKRWLGLAVAGMILALGTGCGPSLHPVEIKVVQDGSPVEGAVVTLIPDGHTVSVEPIGGTDASGVCKIETGGKPGAPKGKYKATVIKKDTGKLEGDPTSMDPLEAMKKVSGPRPAAPAAGGAARPGPAAAGVPKTKDLLPAKYASPETSGLTVEVPSSGQVTLTLTK